MRVGTAGPRRHRQRPELRPCRGRCGSTGAVRAGLRASLGASAIPACQSSAQARLLRRRAVPHALVHRVAVFGERQPQRACPSVWKPCAARSASSTTSASRTVCSAFCVADDVIATASHCVFRTKGETPPPPERFFFARPGTTPPASASPVPRPGRLLATDPRRHRRHQHQAADRCGARLGADQAAGTGLPRQGAWRSAA